MEKKWRFEYLFFKCEGDILYAFDVEKRKQFMSQKQNKVSLDETFSKDMEERFRQVFFQNFLQFHYLNVSIYSSLYC
jgi:hypothetical protein